MQKIGRNDLCPCGSGKKYKKCCGRNIENQIINDTANNDLYKAHQELISFSTTKYSDIIDEQYRHIKQSLEIEDDVKEVHYTGLRPWIVSSVRCLENDQTILEHYYDSIQKKLSPRVREVLAEWLNVNPSAYEVISVNSPKQNLVKLNELGTNDTYYVPYQNKNDFPKGSLLIGSLIPFVNHHDFLLTMMKLLEADIPSYTQLLKKYRNQTNGLNQSYPEFLAEALTYEPEEVDGNESTHEEVAQLSSENLVKKGIKDDQINEGVTHWYTFCENENPIIKKVEPYAAALEYFTQKYLLNNQSVKQADIAKEYGTSASTLSSIYRRIVDAT